MSSAKSLWLAMLLAVLAPAPVIAHYPFPCGAEEKQKARQIELAVEAETQAAVATLAGLLGDKNPRVQTAALLGTMRLANTSLDCTAAVAAATGLKNSEQAFVAAAAKAATILFDGQITIAERRAQLVKLTQSTEGRDRAMIFPRGQCKEGYQGRMAVEALTVAEDTPWGEAVEGAVEKWLALIREGNRDDAARLMARGKNENADDVLSMTVLLEAAAQGNVAAKATHMHPNVALVISKPLNEGRNAGQSFVFHMMRNTNWDPEWRITEVSLVRPEEIAAQLEAFHAKPVDHPVNARGFGPVLERTVRRTSKHTTALDLDANRLIRVPNDFDTNRNVTQDPIKWLVVRGIDVMPQCNPNRDTELSGLGGMLQKVRQVENTLWDESDAAQVRKLLAASKQGMGMQLRASDGSYPVTYVFETFPQPTGESRQGVLQVLAVDQNEQAVKLRYQLVGALRNAEGVKARPPDAVKAVFESLRSGLVEIGTDYPGFARTRDIRVARRGAFYGIDYRHNCTVLQRGYRDDGPNAAYFRFEIYSLPKEGDPFPFATTPPAHRWPALNLAGWSNVYVGKNSSPGVEAKVRDILRRHVAMIDRIAESQEGKRQEDGWGEAVKGVQCRLRLEKTTWEVPQPLQPDMPIRIYAKIDLRNSSKQTWSTTPLELGSQHLQWDGRWHSMTSRAPLLGNWPVRPGEVVLDLDYALGDAITGAMGDDSSDPIAGHLDVGRHTVRVVAYLASGDRRIKAISNPAEMRIAPPGGKTANGAAEWGEPVEGVQCCLRTVKDVWPLWEVRNLGKAPKFKVDLRSQADQPFFNFSSILFADQVHIEWDGKWHKPKHGSLNSGPELSLDPGDVVRDLEFSLDHGGVWGSPDGVAENIWGIEPTAGLHTVRIAVELIAGKKLPDGTTRLSVVSNPVKIQVVPPENDVADAGRAWGEAVEGVQCRLEPEKARWAADEVPKLTAYVRDRGKAGFWLRNPPADGARLQIDGQWYRWGGEVVWAGPPHSPSSRRGPFAFALSRDWLKWSDETRKTSAKEPLKLSPGKHTVRFAYEAYRRAMEDTATDPKEPPLLLISNPVEIEIMPAKEAAWGEPVKGVRVRVKANKSVVRHGETPMLTVDVRNQSAGDIPFDESKRHLLQLKVDGVWYKLFYAHDLSRWGIEPKSLPAGETYEGIALHCGRHWLSNSGLQTLRPLREGGHILRVAYVALDGVRVESNVVRVDVIHPMFESTADSDPPLIGERFTADDVVAYHSQLTGETLSAEELCQLYLNIAMVYRAKAFAGDSLDQRLEAIEGYADEVLAESRKDGMPYVFTAGVERALALGLDEAVEQKLYQHLRDAWNYPNPARAAEVRLASLRCLLRYHDLPATTPEQPVCPPVPNVIIIDEDDRRKMMEEYHQAGAALREYGITMRHLHDRNYYADQVVRSYRFYLEKVDRSLVPEELENLRTLVVRYLGDEALAEQFVAAVRGDGPVPAVTRPKNLKGEDTEEDWGEPVEGVQCRLESEKARWAADEVPKLTAYVRDRGKAGFWLRNPPADGARLQIDGQWYRWGGRGFWTGPTHSPCDQRGPFAFTLTRWWQKMSDKSPLKLSPGKHSVRFAYEAHRRATGTPDTDPKEAPLLLISHPVDIEILPAKETPWGEPVGGVQCRLRTDRVSWPLWDVGELGKAPKFKVDFRNRAEQPFHGLSEQRLYADRVHVEWDGRWYEPRIWGPITGPDLSRPLDPGDVLSGLHFSLDTGGVGGFPGKPPENSWGIKPSAGWHTIRIAVRLLASKKLADGTARISVVSNPVRIQVVPPEKDAADAGPAWGKPVEGAQCRLEAEKARWDADEVPKLTAYVRDPGKSGLWLENPPEASAHLQIDGQWYRWGGVVEWTGPPHSPSSRRGPFAFTLTRWWQKMSDKDPLKLSPGKHTVRFAYEACHIPMGAPAGDPKEPLLLLISNPVVIEIVAAEDAKDATTDEEEEGALEAPRRHGAASGHTRRLRRLVCAPLGAAAKQDSDTQGRPKVCCRRVPARRYDRQVERA